jgi:predicted metal-binding membrane protein
VQHAVRVVPIVVVRMAVVMIAVMMIAMAMPVVKPVIVVIGDRFFDGDHAGSFRS